MIGDEKARWEATYREEAPRLWRALLLATGSAEMASDVMAEAFAQGIARGEQVRLPGAWVWRSAFAIAGGELERMRRPVQPISDPEILAPESVMDLTRALRGLPPRQRVVTVLHYYGGYSLREIASIVGSSRSSVGVHLFRARKALRNQLEVEDDG